MDFQRDNNVHKDDHHQISDDKSKIKKIGGFLILVAMIGIGVMIVVSHHQRSNNKIHNKEEQVILLNKKLITDDSKIHGLDKLRVARSAYGRSSNIDRGYIYINIRQSNRHNTGKSFQPIRFPYVQYSGDYPFSSRNWERYFSRPAIYGDKRNKQTIIKTYPGVVIIPALINKHKKYFSIAQLISEKYATFRRSGALLSHNFDIESYLYPDRILDRKMPKFNYETGRFEGGVATDLKSNFNSDDSDDSNDGKDNYGYGSGNKEKNEYYKHPPQKDHNHHDNHGDKCYIHGYKFDKYEWAKIDGLDYKRGDHTATLLKDDDVFVVGGWNDDISLKYTEIYDISKDKWKQGKSLVHDRDCHTATLLNDNKYLLITGGWDTDSIGIYDTELYNVKQKTWEFVGNLTNGRYYHTATLLNDGRVLVVGGNDTEESTLNTAECYKPANKAWTLVDDMDTARLNHTATLLKDGRVLVTGGRSDYFTTLSSTEFFYPTNNSWLPGPDMCKSRSGHTATLLNDGNVLVAGGYDEDGNLLKSAEIFNVKTNNWTKTGDMSYAHVDYSAVLLKNGKVLVTGGNSTGTDQTPMRTAEIYNPSTGSWTTVGLMHTGRMRHQSTLLPNGNVLVTGGYNYSSSINSAEILCL